MGERYIERARAKREEREINDVNNKPRSPTSPAVSARKPVIQTYSIRGSAAGTGIAGGVKMVGVVEPAWLNLPACVVSKSAAEQSGGLKREKRREKEKEKEKK